MEIEGNFYPPGASFAAVRFEKSRTSPVYNRNRHWRSGCTPNGHETRPHGLPRHPARDSFCRYRRRIPPLCSGADGNHGRDSASRLGPDVCLGHINRPAGAEDFSFFAPRYAVRSVKTMTTLTNFFKESDSRLGVFYPKHYIIGTFPTFEKAKEGAQALLRAGFSGDEVLAVPGSGSSYTSRNFAPTPACGRA